MAVRLVPMALGVAVLTLGQVMPARSQSDPMPSSACPGSAAGARSFVVRVGGDSVSTHRTSAGANAEAVRLWRMDKTRRVTISEGCPVPLLEPRADTPAGRRAVTAATPTNVIEKPADRLPARQPIFIVTPERRATWTRMRAEQHPLFRLASSNCGLTGTPKQRYADTGLWCAWMYQATGDLVAARKGVTRLLATGDSPSNANSVRENFTENVILADWLWEAMGPTDRTTILRKLDGWARFAIGRTGKRYRGGFRVHDSDQTIGSYFGLAVMDRFNRSLNRAGHWLDSTSAPLGGSQVPIGGLVATADNKATARNTIEFFSRRATGGEWHESGHYNLGTIQLVVLGVEAMRTALGRDAFPTTSAFLRQAARRETFAVTPDLAQAVQWGDEEHPRDFRGRLFKRVTMLGMLQGVSGDSATHRLLVDLWSRYGGTGYHSAEPYARILLFYNPYAPVAARLPQGTFVATGRGHLYVKSNRALLFAQAITRTHDDHDVHYLSNIALYRDGAWVLDHPIGYSGDAGHAYATNGVSYAGFGAMPSRRMVRVDSGAGWWSIAGETHGPPYPGASGRPLPEFLHAATRTTIYTTLDDWSVIVTRDSVSMADPRTLPGFDGHRPADKERIMQADGRWETVWHAPVRPRAEGANYTWPTGNGLTVRVLPFGNAIASTVVDEKLLWPKPHGGTGVSPSTKRFQIRTRTASDVLWTVVLVGRGTPPEVTRIGDGVRVARMRVTMANGVPNVLP